MESSGCQTLTYSPLSHAPQSQAHCCLVCVHVATSDVSHMYMRLTTPFCGSSAFCSNTHHVDRFIKVSVLYPKSLEPDVYCVWEYFVKI